MSQKERSVFWEVIVSAILNMRPIPNGLRDEAISLHSTLYTVQTSSTPCPHTSCESALMLTVELSKMYYTGKLYQLCHLDSKYRYVISLSYQQFWNCTLK
jgi:hypothetical protein